MPAFSDYQLGIYLKGLFGETPKVPVDFASLHARAQETMPPDIYSYVACGSGDERTQNVNVSAFDHWGLMPRMLVDCATRDLSVELCGLPFASPLFLAPIGVIGACAKDGHGDLATARAAAATGVPMVASTLSNDPLEAVGEALGSGDGFLSALYAQRQGARRKLRRARRARGLQGARRHARHLDARLPSARSQRREFPAIARRRARQLFQRSQFPRAAQEAAGGGSRQARSRPGRASSVGR